MRRLLTLLAVVAALGAASGLQAQTTAMLQVPFTINVPFTLQRLYPSVTEIQLRCTVVVQGSESIILGDLRSPSMSVAQLAKAADGTLSGEAIATGTATVPATAAGRTGVYRCVPYAYVNGITEPLTHNNPSPQRALASTSPEYVWGTFTW